MMIPQGLCLKHRKVRRTAFGRRQSTILSSSIPKIITFEVAGTTEDQELSVYPTQLLPSKINPPTHTQEARASFSYVYDSIQP